MSTALQETKRKADAGAAEAPTKRLKEELAATKKQLVDTLKELSEAKALIETLQAGGLPEDENVSEDEDDINPEDAWNAKFILFRAFRIQNGHCQVPQKDPILGQWANNQRRAYKSVKTGKQGPLSQSRIEKLDSIGFKWGKDYPEPMSWEQGIEELKKFHKAMGHANIPINENNHTPIAKWIRAQRAEWKRSLLGKDSLLDLEKLAELKEIGFRRKP